MKAEAVTRSDDTWGHDPSWSMIDIICKKLSPPTVRKSGLIAECQPKDITLELLDVGAKPAVGSTFIR